MHPFRIRRAAFAALAVLALCACALPAAASSIEEDDDDVSGADRAFGPPAELLSASRRRAAETGFGWIVGASAYRAGDDNVFRSPSGLERTSPAWGQTLYLRGDARRGGNRSLTTFTLHHTDFDTFRQIDSTHPRLSQWFQHRFSSALALELDLDVVHQNDDATTITGFAYTRDYSWWRYGGEAALEWTPASRHRIRAGAEQVRKDYGEVATLNSIDWSHWRASGSYRFRIAPGHYAGVKYSRGERSYDEEPASLADGNEQPGNPVEHHRYDDVVLWWGAPVRALKLDLDASVAWGSKTDLFQGYEDYSDRTVRLGVLARPHSGLELRAGLVSTHRDYERTLADGGAMLAYDALETRLGARVRVLGTFWLYGDLNAYSRDTNRSSGLDYRDYRGTFTRAGVSVFR